MRQETSHRHARRRSRLETNDGTENFNNNIVIHVCAEIHTQCIALLNKCIQYKAYSSVFI